MQNRIPTDNKDDNPQREGAKVSVARKIYELRKRNRLTQVELGKQIEVSGGAVSQFEKGISNPSYQTLENLSKVLDFDFVSMGLESASNSLLSNAPPLPYSPGATTSDSMTTGESAELITLNFYNTLSFTQRLLSLTHRKREPDTGTLERHAVKAIRVSDYDYSKCLVLEIKGNSMAPRYPHDSWYVLRWVERPNWQYATGVHAIWLKNESLFIRRIMLNKNGELLLSADATGEQSAINISDIDCLWKLGQAVHIPPEE